jgi:ATP-dependent Clp protease, protease subunit
MTTNQFFDVFAQLSDRNMLQSPIIYDSSGQLLDIGSALIRNRIIRFTEQVDNFSANWLKDQLLVLDTLEYKGKMYEDIILYIDNPGGVVYYGIGVIDTMEHIRSRVATVCTGFAASMGSVLLASGEKGKRYSMPKSTIMVHEPSGDFHGRASEIKTSQQEIDRLERILLKQYVSCCAFDEEGNCRWNHFKNDGKPGPVIYDHDIDNGIRTKEDAEEWLNKWWTFDRFMDAELALKWGHIDKIVKPKELPHYQLTEKDEGNNPA